jgi:hypothetical protein
MRSTVVAAILLLSTPAFAGIKVGEVHAPQTSAAVLRRAVEDEVALLRVRQSAIVSVALVKLETRTGDTTCVISATLRTESGAIFAILEGRAQAHGAAESMALRTAVHGAISRIPDAFR